MITQVGFHDMPSVVWRQGRATQLVNPLSALSLLAACRSRSGLAWYDPDPAADRGILAGHATARRFARGARTAAFAPARASRGQGAEVAPPALPHAGVDARPRIRTLGWTKRRATAPAVAAPEPSAPPRGPQRALPHEPAGCASTPRCPRRAPTPRRHGVRRRASPPRLPGPSPPRAARPPCWLIPLWSPPRLLHQPNTAPHSPRRAVITDPFMCGLAALQVYCAISLSRYPRSKCGDRKRGLE